MKKNFYLMVLCLLTCFCLSAGTRDNLKTRIMPDIQKVHSSTILSHSVQTPLTPSALFKSSSQNNASINNLSSRAKLTSKDINRDSDGSVKVTCLFACDELYYHKTGASYLFIDEDGISYKLSGGENVDDIMLQPNKYDIIAKYLYSENEYGHNRCERWVIREQVDITTDTIINLNPNEADCHLQFQPRMPDGEICFPETLLINEDFSYEVLNPGNIGDIYFERIVRLKDNDKIVDSMSGNLGNIWTGAVERDPTHITDIYINEISNRFEISVNMLFYKYNFDGVFYVTNFECSTIENNIISNNPDDYVLYETLFKQSPYGKKEQEGLSPGIKFTFLDKNGGNHAGANQYTTNYTLGENDPWRCYICNKHEEERVYYLISPFVIDGPHPWFDWGSKLEEPNIVEKDGNIIHTNSGLGSTEDYSYNVFPDENNVSQSGLSVIMNQWNSQFSYQIDKMKTISGNSCPILVPTIQSQFDKDGYITTKTLCFLNNIGRNGEYRESDIWTSHVKLLVNGEVEGEVDGQPFLSWPVVAEAEGVVDLTVTNENVDVDGLPGKNVTNIHFDVASDDNTAPTLQMLDFRDTEDNAIDRFATSEDGMLQFYCGDFNEQYIDNEYHPQYFVCNDMADVEVAYSPYQADTWTTLDASEVEEYYYDGMGHYYSAPLASVTGQGLEGWFDLKIKLTDLSGNWQEQVISPAFRIDDLALSAISDAKFQTERTEVARYTLDGRRISTPQPGINIVRYSDGTARKVLVAQ